MYGRDHLERSEFRIGTVDIIAANDDVFEAFLPPLVGDVASEFVVARGAGNVGLSGEDVMLAAFFVRGRDGFELSFDLSLVSRRRRSEAENRGLGLGEER
jgi:hypothetical protein